VEAVRISSGILQRRSERGVGEARGLPVEAGTGRVGDVFVPSDQRPVLDQPRRGYAREYRVLREDRLRLCHSQGEQGCLKNLIMFLGHPINLPIR